MSRRRLRRRRHRGGKPQCRLHDIAERLPSFGTRSPQDRYGFLSQRRKQEATLNGLIYLIGLIVVILAILSFFGLR
jgi:hypothetical protein